MMDQYFLYKGTGDSSILEVSMTDRSGRCIRSVFDNSQGFVTEPQHPAKVLLRPKKTALLRLEWWMALSTPLTQHQSLCKSENNYIKVISGAPTHPQNHTTWSAHFHNIYFFSSHSVIIVNVNLTLMTSFYNVNDNVQNCVNKHFIRWISHLLNRF